MGALLLMILAGVAGRDVGDKLTSGAYLDPSAESQRAAALLTEEFPGGPPNLVLIAETPTGVAVPGTPGRCSRLACTHGPGCAGLGERVSRRP